MLVKAFIINVKERNLAEALQEMIRVCWAFEAYVRRLTYKQRPCRSDMGIIVPVEVFPGDPTPTCVKASGIIMSSSLISSSRT